MDRTKYLIIGNSIAAINAVEAIRNKDKEGGIVIVSDEPYHTYSRPLITYYLGGKIGPDKIFYRPVTFYNDYGIMAILGKEAVRINTGQKMVTLKDDTNIGYEKLLLTPGGAPFMPSIPGRDIKGVFTFTTLDDAYKVKKYIEENNVKRAVVLGGGLIGLKVTEAFLSLGINVTIVELADRILSATFDQTASGLIEHALRRTGCTPITNNTVEEFREKENNTIGSIILKDNTIIECDIAIIAIGVRPRIGLVADTQIEVNRGILVNTSMMTSVDAIYAAGDATESYDFITRAKRPLAILPNASRQGKVAGANMAGADKKLSGCMAMNSIEIAGIPTISVGLTDPDLIKTEERKKNIEVLTQINKEENTYKKIVLEEQRIIGTIFVGRIERSGIYTGLIRDRVDISSFKDHLIKEDFGLISLPKEYRKHLVTGVGIEV